MSSTTFRARKCKWLRHLTRDRLGIDSINRYFHRMNAVGKSIFGRFAQGDPCIWTVNDYDRRLWNGSLGRIVRIGPHSLTADFDGVTHDIGGAELDRIELACRISISEPQDSRFAKRGYAPNAELQL